MLLKNAFRNIFENAAFKIYLVTIHFKAMKNFLTVFRFLFSIFNMPVTFFTFWGNKIEMLKLWQVRKKFMNELTHTNKSKQSQTFSETQT